MKDKYMTRRVSINWVSRIISAISRRGAVINNEANPNYLSLPRENCNLTYAATAWTPTLNLLCYCYTS
jgi:hypothetical protein